MNFEPANINGVKKLTEQQNKWSKFGLIISSTSTYYGQPLILKALSDSALTKEVPVSFYRKSTPTGSGTLIGTAEWDKPYQASLVVNDLGTGTYYLYASWPGEGNYVGRDTEDDLISTSVLAGQTLGGTFNVSKAPASSTLVVGEGTATFTATFSTSTIVPGNIIFYARPLGLSYYQIGSIPIVDNKATLNINNLQGGFNTIQASWPGGTVGTTVYQGLTTSTPYTILTGSTSVGVLTLNVSPAYGIFQEGDITLTASLTNNKGVGYVDFYKNNSVIYTAPIVGNTATYTFNSVDPVGSYSFHANWDGNQTSHPRFLPKKSSTSTFQIYARETVPSLGFSLSANETAFSVPTLFTAVLNTTTNINTGNVIFTLGNNVIGTVPVANNSATFESSVISTGTYIAQAYYSGSSQTPKYYPVYSSTLTMTITEGVSIGANLQLQILSDSYLGTGAPYIKGETITLKSFINTSTVINDFVRFRANGNTVGSPNFNANNTATTTTVFASSGSYKIDAIWDGTAIGGTFYAGQVTSTNITVIDGYTLPSDINITVSTPRITDENIVFTATVTTSTIMQNTVTFFANTLTLGTAQFNTLTNKATLNTTIANSGTYTISATWSGGYIEDNRFYLPKASNTASIFVDIAQVLPGSFTLTLDPSPIFVNSTVTMTATITPVNTSTTVGGTVSFIQTSTSHVYGTGTIVNNIASITTSGQYFNTGTNIITAIWSGQSTTPKYYGKTTSTTATLVAYYSPQFVWTLQPTFYTNNIDGTTQNYVTATITATVFNATYPPTGLIKVYDAGTEISTSSNNSFTWNVTTTGQVNSGTRTLTAIYQGNNYNTTATTSTSFIVRSKRDTTMTLSTTATWYRPDSYNLTIQSTSTYFNGKVLDIYEDGAIIGQSNFIGSTATYTLDSTLRTLGNHSYHAVFVSDHAYNTTQTNTATVTVKKSAIPLFITPYGTYTGIRFPFNTQIYPTGVSQQSQYWTGTQTAPLLLEFTATSATIIALSQIAGAGGDALWPWDATGGGNRFVRLLADNKEVTLGGADVGYQNSATFYRVMEYEGQNRYFLSLHKNINTSTTIQIGNTETSIPSILNTNTWLSLNTQTVVVEFNRVMAELATVASPPYFDPDVYIPSLEFLGLNQTYDFNIFSTATFVPAKTVTITKNGATWKTLSYSGGTVNISTDTNYLGTGTHIFRATYPSDSNSDGWTSTVLTLIVS